MKLITSRTYKDENDLQIILDGLAKFRPARFISDFPQKADIEEKLAVETIRANTRLWFDDGQLVGWAYVDDFNNLHWEVDSQYTDQIGDELVAWGETCIRKMRSAALDANSREDRTERIVFLNQHGFRQLEDITVAMARSLSDPITDPVLPPGFAIRPIKGKEEAEAVAAMHRAAFGTEYMTTENRLIIMSTREYDPSLDLLVIAPNGKIAAYCTCSVNAETQIGMTDPVATHPNYQRMGLSRAILLTGMRMLKERGMESAHLGTSGENIAMQKAAESVGFRVEHKTLWFSKVV
ncbi:MAG: GNAT family N-acetyltransferase [Anaerolineales bacterium]